MGIAKYFRTLRNNIAEDRRAFAVYSVLRLLVIATLIRSAVAQRWEGVGICAFTLVLLLVPTIVEQTFQLDIPTGFQTIIYVFIFAAEILGEVDHFYVHIPGWDTMLHTINGFLCAAVGFSMLYLLNRKSKNLRLSPAYLAMVAFCFSMTVGVCWEFVECIGDSFFGQDMQKDTIVQSFNTVTLDPAQDQNIVPVHDIKRTIIETSTGNVTVEGGYLDIGLLDTMKDLFVNFIGAAVFSVIGFALVEHDGKATTPTTRFARSLLVRPTEQADMPSTATEGVDMSSPGDGLRLDR